MQFLGQADYADHGTVDLARIDGTDVWWTDIDLPSDSTVLYTFHRADREGTITEDVHEGWPANFPDVFNVTRGREIDSSYAANAVSTRAERSTRPGTVRSIDVPASYLLLPKHHAFRGGAWVEPHPASFPVWTYTPNPRHTAPVSAPLPLVVLMNGQLLECSDLVRCLDRAIEDGTMPPVVVAAPGLRGGGHTAWGWRNGYGPDELSAFFAESLVPSLVAQFPVAPAAHVVAWDYTTFAAIETALRAPEVVSSMILFMPQLQGLAISGNPFQKSTWLFGQAVEDLVRRSPGFPIAIASPSPRTGRFTWNSADIKDARVLVADAGASLIDVVISDPNLAAAAAALGSAVGAVVGGHHSAPGSC